MVFIGGVFYPVILPGSFSQNISWSGSWNDWLVHSRSVISPSSCSQKVRRSKELADNYHQSRLWSGLGSFCYARLSKHDKTPPDISNVNICLLTPPKPSYVAKIPPKVLFNKPQCSCQRHLCQSYSVWCHPSSTGIVPAWPSKQKLMKHSH